jgi:hypothetical protein
MRRVTIRGGNTVGPFGQQSHIVSDPLQTVR